MFNVTSFARIFYDTQGYTHSSTSSCTHQAHTYFKHLSAPTQQGTAFAWSACSLLVCLSIYQALMSKYSSPKNVTTTVRSANFLPASAASAFCAEAGSSYLT